MEMALERHQKRKNSMPIDNPPPPHGFWTADPEKSDLSAKAFQELREREKTYRDLFDHAPIGIFCLTAQGIPLFMNAAMARILGFSSPEAVITHSTDLGAVFWLQQGQKEKILRHLRETEAMQPLEYVLTRVDNRRIWVCMNARMRKGLHGDDFLIEGFARDITARKDAEQALLHQSRLQHLLMEIAATYINLPLADVDAHIQKSLGDMACFVNADRAYICTYDFEKKICTNTHEWCRQGIEPQIHHLQAVPFSSMEDWVEAHVQARPIHIPLVSDLPRGGARDVLEPQGIQSLLAIPMVHMQTCLGFIGFDSVRSPHAYSGTEQQLLSLFAQMLVNVGLRKKAQEDQNLLQAQLLQAQKMESVGRLAGGVAHDFNNMLSVIIGHAELALEDLHPESPLRSDLTQIQQAARRSADLTRQLLAFARKQTAMPQVLDLNETVSGMLKMLQRLIGENIRLRWLPEANLWPVLMDPGQIDQILANLCVNARDAIEGTGEITIRTCNASFDPTHAANHKGFLPGDYVVLSVHDTGCGMAPEIIPHLFEPFFTTKAMGKGTGLGLATVYGIVKQNEGYIQVHSTPGKGCTLDIYLPPHRGETWALDREKPRLLTGRPHETILVAEDEPAILKMTQRMLESLGYTVLVASSPEKALESLQSHTDTLDLLITDVIMPGMNGRDLADMLSRLHPGFKTLFISGYTADVIDRHGVLDDGVHFIQKPFSRTDLAHKVREVLDEP
jgi:PAS domain S-box-containing protein